MPDHDERTISHPERILALLKERVGATPLIFDVGFIREARR